MEITPQSKTTKIIYGTIAALIIIFATVIIYPGLSDSLKQVKRTPMPTATRSATPRPSATHTRTAIPTLAQPTIPVPITATADTDPENIVAYPAAPVCPDGGEAHDNSLFHTLWDSSRGCHYDHEHGQDPFTPEVAAAFPGFDLLTLLGGVEIGHPNPSGPMENTHKHGGFKWNVQLQHPQPCVGFEAPAGQTITGANGSAILYHNFGDYAAELDAAKHSTAFLIRQCKTSNPTDYGYIFGIQHVAFGQNISPYQGDLLLYPHYTHVPYATNFGPYWSIACIGQKLAGQLGACRTSLQQAQANQASSVWSTKATGTGRNALISNSSIFGFLGRTEDTYQMLDWRDQTYPYTFLWLCTSDGGVTFKAAGCKFANLTTQIHEIKGFVDPAWESLVNDTDSRSGRITAEFFVTEFGQLAPTCTVAGPSCHKIKLVNAFVGPYASLLAQKGAIGVPLNPSRNICFNTAGAVVGCDVPGAVPSGWVGSEN